MGPAGGRVEGWFPGGRQKLPAARGRLGGLAAAEQNPASKTTTEEDILKSILIRGTPALITAPGQPGSATMTAWERLQQQTGLPHGQLLWQLLGNSNIGLDPDLPTKYNLDWISDGLSNTIFVGELPVPVNDPSNTVPPPPGNRNSDGKGGVTPVGSGGGKPGGPGTNNTRNSVPVPPPPANNGF